MGWISDRLDAMRDTHPVPPYAAINRSLWPGTHGFLALMPRARESPALRRVEPDDARRELLVTTARVRITTIPGFAFINTRVPCVMLSWTYYVLGSNLDVYLDLLHELTHLRQLNEGKDLWDKRFAYVDRATEIEGYAVAVEEGRRLGMSDTQIQRHLHNPWMSAEDVERLKQHITRFLSGAPR